MISSHPLTYAVLALMASMPGQANCLEKPCAALAAAGLQDRLLTANDAAYEARINTWWSASNRLEPACIVQPKDTEEVAKVLKTLQNTTGSFAIRSGGHSHWAGGSNVDGGVTIDLVHFKGATYDASTNLASVYPSNRWADVFETLEAQGVAVPGGRDGNVGVGGFLTGGGNSYYTARVGFGCDSIVNAEVVLADGTVVNANKDEHPDLLRALKGGWGNFGIVTRFDLEAFPAGPVWGGIRASTPDQGELIANAMVNFTANQHKNPNSALLINWTYNPAMSSGVLLAQVMIDTTGVERGPAFEEPLKATELFNDFSTRSMSQVANAYLLPNSLHNVWFTLTFANDVRVITKMAELHDAFVADLLEVIPALELGTQSLIQPVPRLFADHGVARGGNVLGLDRVEGDSLMWLLSCTVATAEQEVILHEKSAAFTAELAAFARSIGALREWEYLNYADPSQDPFRSYGAENVKFLREVSAKYDPTGFFQTRQAGGFKLPKA